MICSRPLIVVLLAILISGRVAQQEDELKAVVVLFRHGHRTPTMSWPNDPYFGNSSLWPEGYGMLTNFGKQHHFQLGQWFRQRYNGFLPLRYNTSDIYVRTTDLDRTYMSAASNLAGLYQPYEEQVWNKDILWQPIPIHTVPENQDDILVSELSCPKYKLLLEKFSHSDEYKQLEAENTDLYEQLAKVTGYSVDKLNIFAVIDIFTSITIYEKFNFSLPEWTKTLRPQLAAVATKAFLITTYTPELARINSGPFFHTLIQYFKAIKDDDISEINSIPVRKFWMFSAHDTTIADHTNSIGIFPNVVPEFSSTVIWELRKKHGSDRHYVNIYFKNHTHFDGLTVPDCEFNCDLDVFIELTKPVTVDIEVWRKECNKI